MEINPALKPYIPLAHMLVQTLGSDSEAVLHDLRDPEHSVVYTVNPTVTGRKIGQSFDQLIRQVIFSRELRDDYVANYYFHAPNGKLIRSSTLLIRSADGTLTGALCLNIDTSRITAQIDYLKSFLPTSAPLDTNAIDDSNRQENQHVTQMITALIDNILAGCEPQQLNREEKLCKVRFMDEKGIFLMKGSIEQVAEKLGINKVTVYSYLDTIRGKRN